MEHNFPVKKCEGYQLFSHNRSSSGDCNFKFTFTEESRFGVKSVRKNRWLHLYEYIKSDGVTMLVHWTLLLSSGMFEIIFGKAA